MPYKVELQYFKPSGKYYSTGEYESNKEHLHQIWDEVDSMLRAGNRPGLVDGKDYFVTLINTDHPHAHPFIHNPTEPYE